MAGISKEERSELLRAIKAADANFKKGMYALAEPAYRKGVEFLGDGAPEITTCLQNLAQICSERKDYNEALKLDIQLLLLNEERFGEDHAKTIALMDEIAGLYEKLGRTDESRDMYERARKASERSLWADQSNEPDGVPSPAEVSDDLDLGYQYSDTAKTALETAPAAGEVAYEFGAASPDQKKRDLAEETMKLPKLRDDQTPPQKDPQLETLILDRKELKKNAESQKIANGIGDGAGAAALKNDGAEINSVIANSATAGVDALDSGLDAATAAAIRSDPKASDILKKMKAKLSESITTTVVDPNAPILESPEVIGIDAIKENQWKSDSAMSKVVLGKALKQPGSDKGVDGMNLIDVDVVEAKNSSVARVDKSTDDKSKDSGKDRDKDKDGVSAKPAVVAASNKKKQPTEVKLFQSDKQRNLILGIFIGCFALLVLASLFTSHANTQEDFKNMAHRYRTVDGEKLFFLTSPSECEFVAGADTAKMPYYQHHGDFLDTSRIIFGPLLHHPHWLTKLKNGVEDQQGSILYAEASPELSIADFAEGVGKAAELSYLKTKHYPKKLDELEFSKRAYRNPFSGQLDKPVIQAITLGKKTQADDGGQRKKLYDTAISGARFPNEAKRHPGGINCYSVVIHTKKGDLQSFYIRAFDRDGKPFMSSQPESVYVTVLENGKEKVLPRPHLPFSTSTLRPHRAWLMPALNPAIDFLYRYGAVGIFALAAFASWILSEAIRDKNIASSTLKLASLACLLLGALYLLSGILP